MICPKCRYEANESDPDVMPGVCPACGIAYEKYRASQALYENEREEPELPAITVREPAVRRLIGFLTYVPAGPRESLFWGQAALYAVFFLWGWSFILGGVDWPSIGGSFLHNINLPFHEFGHVLFSFFGDYMMLLGGSLFQAVMPLGLMLIFMIKQRDNFSASLMLWWSGQNFIDVSPYVADAPTRFIPLVGNRGPESHDWWNLLAMSGTLDRAGFYAECWFATGVAIIILSYVWGGVLLMRKFAGGDGLKDGPVEDDETGI